MSSKKNRKGTTSVERRQARREAGHPTHRDIRLKLGRKSGSRVHLGRRVKALYEGRPDPGKEQIHVEPSFEEFKKGTSRRREREFWSCPTTRTALEGLGKSLASALDDLEL